MSTEPTYEQMEQYVKDFEEAVERKRRENVQREIGVDYSTLLDLVNDGLYVVNNKGRFVFVNKVIEQRSGISFDKFVGMHFLDVVSPKDHDRVNANFEKGMRGEKVSPYELEYPTSEGKPLTVEVNTRPIWSRGKLIGLEGVSRDITERKRIENELRQAHSELEKRVLERTAELLSANDQLRREILDRKRSEKAVRESEKKYRNILESIEEGYYETDLAGNFVFFNDSMRRLLGYSSVELTGMNYRQCVDQKHAKDVYKTFNNVYNTGTPDKQFDWQVIKKDGLKRHIEASVALIIDNEGHRRGFRGVVRDITDRKRSEEALKEHARRNELILSTAMEGFCVMDFEGNIVEANHSASQIYGYPIEELIGMNIYDFDLRTPRHIIRHRRKVIRNGFDRFEAKHRLRDGLIADIQVSINFLNTGKGYFFCFFNDISKRKETERALREKEKDLRAKAFSLKEANSALKLLLKKREEDRKELEQKILINIKEAIFPYLEILKKGKMDDGQKTCLSILESSLKDITSPFSRSLTSRHINFTPAEMKVANLVRQGKPTRGIADFLNLSTRTIEDHRKNIRGKLGLRNKKINLRSHLLSFGREDFQV